MAGLPAPETGIALTHFIVSDDVERSRRFYTEVLGGETVREGEPTFAALANSWIIINVGGGPSADASSTRLSPEKPVLPTAGRRSGFSREAAARLALRVGRQFGQRSAPRFRSRAVSAVVPSGILRVLAVHPHGGTHRWPQEP